MENGELDVSERIRACPQDAIAREDGIVTNNAHRFCNAREGKCFRIFDLILQQSTEATKWARQGINHAVDYMYYFLENKELGKKCLPDVSFRSLETEHPEVQSRVVGLLAAEFQTPPHIVHALVKKRFNNNRCNIRKVLNLEKTEQYGKPLVVQSILTNHSSFSLAGQTPRLFRCHR